MIDTHDQQLLQQVACDLPTDRDVLRLSQSCKGMWEKIFEEDSSIWRDRFSKHYDLPPGRPSRELKIEYQIRAIVLNSQMSFKGKEDNRQYLWMEVLKTMLEEALQAPTAPGKSSKTLDCIYETLRGVDFLSEFQKRGTPSQLFYALQLVCQFFLTCGVFANIAMQSVYLQLLLILYSLNHVAAPTTTWK